MELWDLYDINRIRTGKQIVRGEKLLKNSFHMVVHVCIFNSKGEMLIQQRQPFKQGWPNMWDVTVGGSSVTGESSQEAAKREVFEEIGYIINLNDIRPHLTINFEYGFDDFYLLESNVDLTTLKLQYEEVQNVKWATLKEIIKMINQGNFIPYHKSLINLLFETRNSFGAIKSL